MEKTNKTNNSNNKKMTKNSKNSKDNKNKKNKKSSKINWRVIIIVLICFAAGFGIGFGIMQTVKKSKAADLDVAFYQLPDAVVENLEKRITEQYSGKIAFTKIADDEYDSRRIAKQYDLFFTWNGSAVDRLGRYCQELPVSYFEGMPTSLRNKGRNCLPFAIDHYEVAYYKKGREKAQLDFPQNIVELQDYLEVMKGYVFTPFFCAGGDDDTLIALITTFVESLGGIDSYEEFISLFDKKPSLAQNIDINLAKTNRKEDEFSIRTILDMLRRWQQESLVHPNWFIAKKGDVEAFLEDDQIGVLFTSLSTHRTIPYKLISKVDADRMPVFSVSVNHGLIAPSMVAVKLTKYPYFDSILADLVLDQTQKELSVITRLGPVSSRAQAYDRQADDVRFLSAACKGGPLPPLQQAVFQTNKTAVHNLAEEIRYYLRTGFIKAQ